MKNLMLIVLLTVFIGMPMSHISLSAEKTGETTAATSESRPIVPAPDAALAKELLKTGTDHLRNYFSKGELLEFTAAVRAFNRILTIDPTDENARMMLGILYTRKGREMADGLVRDGLGKPAGYFRLGNLLLMQNRFDEAIGCYDKVNAAIPAWTCPFRHKGEALMKAGRNEEAIIALRRSIEVKKDHFDAYVFLARALTAAGRFAEAEKELDTAVEVHAKSGQCAPHDEEEATMKDCWAAYAELYDKLGKPDKAAVYRSKIKTMK